MLSEPKYGWTQVEIGDFSQPASYLTDVPMDFLEGFINYLKTGKETEIKIDGEGAGCFSIALSESCIRISDDSGEIKHTVNVCPEQLAKELVSDIEQHLDLWAVWPPECDGEFMTEEEISEYIKDRKETISSSVKEISHFQLDRVK